MPSPSNLADAASSLTLSSANATLDDDGASASLTIGGTLARRVGCVALGLLLTGAAWTAQAQNAAVYTYHNDTLRTGWQQNETVLTTSNAGQLTLLHTLKVNGRISAQPLVVSNQSLNGNTPRSSVVYVVTDQDYLYAFDGDTGQKLGSTQISVCRPAGDVARTIAPKTPRSWASRPRRSSIRRPA